MTVIGFAARGTAIGAVLGAVVGLILGLIAYPPTAWFATLEVSLPAAVAGGGIGLVAGVVVLIWHHLNVQRTHVEASEPDSIHPG